MPHDIDQGRAIDFEPLRAPSQSAAVMVRRMGARMPVPRYIVRLLGVTFASMAYGVVLIIGAGLILASDPRHVETVLRASVAFGASVLGFVGTSLAVVGLIVLTIVWNFSRSTRVPSLADRLPAFAAANGFDFSASDTNPQYPGGIFTRGNAREAINHISSKSGRFFDVGDFRFEPTLIQEDSRAAATLRATFGSAAVDDGVQNAYSMWGYIAIDLGRSLPHIVLEPRSDEVYVALAPMVPDRDQVLTLEGDFNSHFTLYCPSGYEQDALYIFAPDLMGLLVDWAEGLNVEIVDRWLFIYSWRPFSSAIVSDYEHAFRIIDLVGTKSARQTMRYADGRSGERGSVAPGGRALRRDRSRLVTWVVPALVVGSGAGAVLGIVSTLMIRFV